MLYTCTWIVSTIFVATGIKEMRSTKTQTNEQKYVSQLTQRQEIEERSLEESRLINQEGTGSRNQEERETNAERGEICQEGRREVICQEERRGGVRLQERGEGIQQQERRSRSEHWVGDKRAMIRNKREQMAGIGGRFVLPDLDEMRVLSSPPPTVNYEDCGEDGQFYANVEEQDLYENY